MKFPVNSLLAGNSETGSLVTLSSSGESANSRFLAGIIRLRRRAFDGSGVSLSLWFVSRRGNRRDTALAAPANGSHGLFRQVHLDAVGLYNAVLQFMHRT